MISNPNPNRYLLFFYPWSAAEGKTQNYLVMENGKIKYLSSDDEIKYMEGVTFIHHTFSGFLEIKYTNANDDSFVLGIERIYKITSTSEKIQK